MNTAYNKIKEVLESDNRTLENIADIACLISTRLTGDEEHDKRLVLGTDNMICMMNKLNSMKNGEKTS